MQTRKEWYLMKQNRFQEKKAISSKSEYLSTLGRHLIWHFPFQQALEILADYQEYLSIDHEQGSTMETIVAQWGSPESVADRLLEESPEAKPRFYKHLALWLFVFLVASYGYFHVPYGSYAFLAISSFSLFGFLHLGNQARIEYRFAARNGTQKKNPVSAGNIPRPLLIVHCALPILVLLVERLAQYVINRADVLPERVGPLRIGYAIGYISCFFQILVLLLLIWTMIKTLCTSVHYFPATVHAMGTLLFIMDTRSIFSSMDLSATGDTLLHICAQCLAVYGLGAALAIFFQMLLSMYIQRSPLTHATMEQADSVSSSSPAPKDDMKEQATQDPASSQDDM